MVKAVRVCLYAVTFYVIINIFSKSYALERQVKDFVYNNNGLGAYSFEFESIDGTFRREDGGISKNTKGVLGFVVRGVYGFIDPEGRHHSVRYVADADGFQPQADDGDISEDVELRRIFPSEFPQDTVRKSGVLEPEHLGRYFELMRYFKYPKSKLNSHFEELNCYNENGGKVCKVDVNRYSPDEQHYMSSDLTNHVDRRRVFCLMLLCFTEDELDRVVASF